jgi:hypothetical protein
MSRSSRDEESGNWRRNQRRSYRKDCEFVTESNAYDPSERLDVCHDGDASSCNRIEIEFGINVAITQYQQRMLHELISEIVSDPWNQPKEGVHWLAGSGSKPRYSQADCHFLGIPVDANAPIAGEPTFDDCTLFMETCARGFVSETERERKLKERAKEPTPNPERDEVLEVLEAVAYFWEKDPKAFGDDATIGSIASRFEIIARKCQRLRAKLLAEKARKK